MTQAFSVYEWLAARVTVWSHSPVCEFVGVTRTAQEPECTGVFATPPPGWHVHGESAPDSNPGLTIAPGGGGVDVPTVSW